MKAEVRALFHELADLSPVQRQQVFSERQIGSALRAEVESLLEFDSTNGQSLADCVSGAAGEALGSAGEPSYCGPYRLIRLLGSGGMGAVFLAERTDGEIDQNVAVKLVGSQSHRPVRPDRFLKERQFLASLHHPSIVHVIDAGHTADGRPYLVMEYVDGIPIDVYARELTVRDCLTLFLRVCDGVSHAHHRLIIHRDLKPTNILVDVSGQPKLLDFGIAKLLDQTGDPTQTVERLLTPNYASPEQLRGASQTIATDVYSLGAVLYKLLTGRSPHESDTNTSQAFEVIAGTRKIPLASRLNPRLSTDIDYILQKALRHEPEERYPSVEAFANDIRAFLESRPVQARSGNAWYRTRRFLRRYRVPVAAAIITIAGLSLGLYIANQQRIIAQRRFVLVRQLASKLFDIDVQVAQLQGGSKTRQFIVDTSLEYLRRLTSDARMDPDLALEVATAFMRVARVQGVNISPNLGQTDQAEQTELKAQALINSVLALKPANRMALFRSAQVAHDRMILAGDRHNDEEALKFAQESEERLDKYLKTGKLDAKSDGGEAQQVIITQMNVANRYLLADQFDQAIRLSRRAIDIARATNWPAQAGAALMTVALAHRAQGNLDEALHAIRESVRMLEPPAGTPGTGRLASFSLALVREGQILGEDNAVSIGRSTEAAEFLERAFDISERFAQQDPKDFRSRLRLFTAGTKLADILRHTQPRRALEIYDQVLLRLAEVQGNAGSRSNEVRTLVASSYPLQQLGRSVEARQRLDAAFERLRQLKLYPVEEIKPGSEAAEAVRALGDYEAKNGNLQRAIELYQKLLAGIEIAKPKLETSLAGTLDMSNTYSEAAVLHRKAGQLDRAAMLETRRLQLWRGWDRRLPRNAFVLRQLEAAGLR